MTDPLSAPFFVSLVPHPRVTASQHAALVAAAPYWFPDAEIISAGSTPERSLYVGVRVGTAIEQSLLERRARDFREHFALSFELHGDAVSAGVRQAVGAPDHPSVSARVAAALALVEGALGVQLAGAGIAERAEALSTLAPGLYLTVDLRPADALQRTPYGTINNCALANGGSEAECQVCHGACPDRSRFFDRG